MAPSVRVQPGAALGEREGAVADLAELRRLLERAVRATLRHEKVSDAEISVTLLDDDEIADMNGRFLQHDGPTDVISFALYEEGEDPVGDVYIGYEQALRQAAADGVPPTEEIARVVIHGVLHVLGHDHSEGSDRVESEMWRVQEAVLQTLLAR
jgi:probable rRNA maturation factor